MRKKIGENSGITLIALVITIIILLILAGIAISALNSENGIFKNAQKAKEEAVRSEATEMMNLKLAEIQIESYNENGSFPDLQYVAEKLCENKNGEIKNVSTTSSKTGALASINVVDKIYVVLVKYPTYEFLIDSSSSGVLKIAEVIDLENKTKEPNPDDEEPTELSAGDIGFSPTNKNWTVNNVKDALDYLYEN